MMSVGLRRMFAIMAKEFRQLSRDRMTLGMIAGMPLAQIMIFGYGINYDVRNVRTGVVDLAATSGSRQFLAELSATQVVTVVVQAGDPERLRGLMASGAECGAERGTDEPGGSADCDRGHRSDCT